MRNAINTAVFATNSSLAELLSYYLVLYNHHYFIIIKSRHQLIFNVDEN